MSSHYRCFPLDLLTAPIAERIEYFYNLIIEHKALKSVDADIFRAITTPSSGSLIFLVGPSGAGKSTIIKTLVRRIIEAESPSDKDLQYRIPAAWVDVKVEHSTGFRWPDLFLRMLIALQDPLPYKKTMGMDVSGLNEISLSSKKEKTYFRAVEKAIMHRDPIAFFIDEAQDIGKVSGAKSYHTQFSVLKGFANGMRGKLILAGTYELLPFMNLSGQLSNRAIHVHLPRYNAKVKKDITSFKSAVKTFQKHLPLAEEPDLESEWEFLYERSIGCIGSLKRWLVKALQYALTNESDTLTRHYLEMTALSVKQCANMLEEAQSGEKQLQEDRGERLSLLNELGLPNEEKVRQMAQRKLLPGQRAPKRDPVGSLQTDTDGDDGRPFVNDACEAARNNDSA